MKNNRRGCQIPRDTNIHPEFYVHPEFYDHFDNDAEAWQEHHHWTQQATYKYGCMGFIGAGVGDAAKEAPAKWDVDAVIARVGDITLTIEWADYDYEDNSYRRGVEEKTTRELCETLTTDTRWYKPGDLADRVKNLRDIGQMVAEMYDGDSRMCFFGTRADYDKKRAEERRKELEGVAKRFAADNGIMIGTFDFIHKVEEAIYGVAVRQRDFNSGEQRAERYAACMFAGCRDSFFSDNDFENDRFSNRRDNLEGVLEWLRSECPLLMAQYEELKLKGEWKSPVDELVEA